MQFDPEAGLEWQLTNEKDGSVSGTCQNSEGALCILAMSPSPNISFLLANCTAELLACFISH